MIAAAHAGWKGAFSGIIESTIAAMQQLGANPAAIIATIGPAIAQVSYEVGAEFYENFMKQDAENTQFFVSSSDSALLLGNQQDDKYLFNLPAYGKHRLEQAGIHNVNIIAQDTFTNDKEFFSYRRSCKHGENAYGRQISAIMIME